jgi:hypothetical protein
MLVSSLSLATAIIQCNVTTNPTVVNSRDTVLSWYIANDGLRAETLTIPDPVKNALGVLYNYIGNPTTYRDLPILPEEDVDGGYTFS